MTVPEGLRRAELMPLWRAVHERLSSGREVSRVRVGPLEEEQRAALADLLGLARTPGPTVTVTVSRLDAVLDEVCGRGSREVVAEVVGPLDDRARRLERQRDERARLWEWLAAHEVVTERPVLADWAEQLRRGGLVDGSVPTTRKLLEDALRVLRRLPEQGVPLPAFASDVLGDPHALDGGTRLSSVVLRALAVLSETEPPGGAEQRRELWERAGVSEDELSAVVLAVGLSPSGDGAADRVLRASAESGHAAALTLAQLRDGLTATTRDVYVVENPTVLTLALRRFGRACPALVCTSGWPNSAGILLLRRAADSGARLHYHGDFDGEGLRIAAHVFTRTPAQPWRMSAEDYRAALPRETGPEVGRVTEAPWDSELADALREHGVAVPEERVAETLLDDLG